MKDYYRILGLSSSARAAEIRRRYRQLARACHPDRIRDAGRKTAAEERLKEINEAYEVLSDPDLRAQYDRRRRGRAGRRTGTSYAAQAAHPPAAAGPAVSPVEDLGSIPYAGRSSTEHLHYSFSAARGDMVEISLDSRANVILLDEVNYSRYRMGRSFQYLGGYVRYSPVTLPVLFSGYWHLVVDLGGNPGSVRVRPRLVRRRWW